MEEGRAEEAMPYLQEEVALAPSNAYCHFKLGVACLRLRRFGEARQELERAAQLDSNNAAAHYQLGRFYKEIHDLDHAKAEFDRTMEIQSRANRPTPPKPKQ